jgi:hypothetical protein
MAELGTQSGSSEQTAIEREFVRSHPRSQELYEAQQ